MIDTKNVLHRHVTIYIVSTTIFIHKCHSNDYHMLHKCNDNDEEMIRTKYLVILMLRYFDEFSLDFIFALKSTLHRCVSEIQKLIIIEMSISNDFQIMFKQYTLVSLFI